MTYVVTVEVKPVVTIVVCRRGETCHHGGMFQFQRCVKHTSYNSYVAHRHCRFVVWGRLILFVGDSVHYLCLYLFGKLRIVFYDVLYGVASLCQSCLIV